MSTESPLYVECWLKYQRSSSLKILKCIYYLYTTNHISRSRTKHKPFTFTAPLQTMICFWHTFCGFKCKLRILCQLILYIIRFDLKGIHKWKVRHVYYGHIKAFFDQMHHVHVNATTIHASVLIWMSVISWVRLCLVLRLFDAFQY